MNALFTIVLLVVANIFMTFAWYGHLKLQEMGKIDHTPLILIILGSWILAFFEYLLQIPANRMGYIGNGGTFTLVQLKIIQEVITLLVFSVFSFLFFNTQIQWNHLVAFFCLILAVYFVFMK